MISHTGTPVKRDSIFSSGGGSRGGRGLGDEGRTGNGNRERPGSSVSSSIIKKKTARGRFLEGVWYCDCEQRLPANRFQTKNGGVNHGRWFYTCQKPRSEQCGFFLWDNDAKLRAERALFMDGRLEGSPLKSTHVPRATGLPTPRTSERAWPHGSGQRAMSDPFATPTKKGRSAVQQPSSLNGLFTDDEGGDEDDSFGWDEDLEAEVGKLTQQDPVPTTPTPRLPPETPRKVARTDTLTSPGKRKFVDMQGDESSHSATNKVEGSRSSFPLTPGTWRQPPSFPSLNIPQTDSLQTTSSVGLATPTPARFSSQDPFVSPNNSQGSNRPQGSSSSSSSHCALATQAVTLIEAHNVSLNQAAKDDLLCLLDRYDLKTQGITRGREITRLALQKKEEKIKELTGRIEALEAEREMGKTAITGLKMQRGGNR